MIEAHQDPAQNLAGLPAAFLAPSGAANNRIGERRCLVAVDGGATKTVAAAFDPTGYTAFTGRAGPANQLVVGEEAGLAAVYSSVEAALSAGNLTPQDVSSAVLGIAGIQTEDDERRIGAHVADRFGFPAVHAVNDVVIAWAAGTAGKPGLVLIAGTGSNAFGVNKLGECCSSGGWGSLLGDEGSAYWISVAGMKAALAFHDGRGDWTSLYDATIRHFGLNSIEALPALFNRLRRDEVAAFAKLVQEEAAGGDPAAVRVYKEAGEALGVHAAAIVRRLEMRNESFVLATAGSVFNAGKLIIEPLEAAVARFAPKAALCRAPLTPAGGGLILAARAAGQPELDASRLAEAMPVSS